MPAIMRHRVAVRNVPTEVSVMEKVWKVLKPVIIIAGTGAAAYFGDPRIAALANQVLTALLGQ